jgi:hypothetical protein
MRTKYSLPVYCSELFEYDYSFRPELIDANTMRKKYNIVYDTAIYHNIECFEDFIDVLHLSDIKIVRINKCVYDIIKQEFGSKAEMKTYLDYGFKLYSY